MANDGVGAVDGKLESEESERERESSGRERGRKSRRFYRVRGERASQGEKRAAFNAAAAINGAMRERTWGRGERKRASVSGLGRRTGAGGRARADVGTGARAVRGQGA
jgi:hypothetical protein